LSRAATWNAESVDATPGTRHELTSPALLPAELTLSARGLGSLGVSTAFNSPLAVLLCLVGLLIELGWDSEASSGVRTWLLDCDASLWSCSCGTTGRVGRDCSSGMEFVLELMSLS
jgi:hypothetical protein